MILIITHKEDYTADFVIDKLNHRAIEYYRFNCEDIESKEYSIRFGKNNSLNFHELASINSIWFRRTKLPHLANVSVGESIYLLSEYEALLSNLYNLLASQRWLSYPPFVYEAENKLFQIKTAIEIGFCVPETIISNSKKMVKEFARANEFRLIIKPLSLGRIIDENESKMIYTNIITQENINALDEYTLTPSIIQRYIDKEYEIRATVVGDKVFAAKVNSQGNENTKIDWRREKIKFSAYDLPKDISQKCLAIVQKMNLSFGAIDLIKRPDGEYIFLEINPNGQWAWIEFDTELPISDAIIEFLMK